MAATRSWISRPPCTRLGKLATHLDKKMSAQRTSMNSRLSSAARTVRVSCTCTPRHHCVSVAWSMGPSPPSMSDRPTLEAASLAKASGWSSQALVTRSMSLTACPAKEASASVLQ